ncbi:MAG: DNA repair protein RadA, partial [Pseudomonadota bacterium]|nr:DNA repair protein RadA [Pseudomonadota bacterium]
MARAIASFTCQECGAVHSKWTGQCDGCGAWNTVVEEAPTEQAPKGLGASKGQSISFVGLSGKTSDAMRRVSGIGEFDRVCGGGLVPGSAVLIGGD